MIFGSSVAYHHFNPKTISDITGNSAYNMGWDGTFFIQYNCLIKEYISYSKQVKCIVIANDFSNLETKHLISRPDLFYAYLNNNYVYESLHNIEPKKIWRAKYVPGYKLTLLSKSFYSNILFNVPNANLLGFTPANGDWQVADSTNSFNIDIDETIFNELKVTTKMINERNVNIVFVMPPVYKDGYKLILNRELIKSRYKSLVNKNIYFLDYTTDSICNSREYFCNYGHLNAKGADVFSKKFSYDLKNILDNNH